MHSKASTTRRSGRPAALHRKFLGFIRDLPQIQSFVVTSGDSHALAQNATSGFALLHKLYSIREWSDTLHRAAQARRSASA